MKKVVITGPTGAVGTALINALLTRDCKIFAVVRPGSKRLDNIPVSDKLKLVECDISELSKLPTLIGSADIFYHFAWQGTTGAGRNDMQLQNSNVANAIAAVECAKLMGCECFIGAGSQAEYGRVSGVLTPDTPCFPDNGYGMAKLCAGQMTRAMCQSAGIRHVWPRILSIYGPCDGAQSMIMSTIRSLIDGKRPSLTAGEQMWDYLFSGDVGEIMARLGERGVDGKIYCLGSGVARPLREYIEELRDVVNPGAELGFGDIPYGDKQVMYLRADIEDIQKDLGYTPETVFTDGIRITCDWILESQRVSR